MKWMYHIKLNTYIHRSNKVIPSVAFRQKLTSVIVRGHVLDLVGWLLSIDVVRVWCEKKKKGLENEYVPVEMTKMGGRSGAG